MAGSIWKGSLSFGLLNIPVTLQKAQQEKDLSFSMLDGKDFSPIKYKKVNGKSGHEVPWDRIVKGYEYEKGQYVIMTKDDFKAAIKVRWWISCPCFKSHWSIGKKNALFARRVSERKRLIGKRPGST